jgi:hypothetical protein
MPSDEIYSLFGAGKLHSGSGGIVKDPKQAAAIYHSYRRKEGKEKKKPHVGVSKRKHGS